MEQPIDLRSDVVAPPTEAMWTAMRSTQLGWALRGEDRAVNALEALGAELTGKEAALWVPTCSMANLLALMTLGERGTQVVLEATAHIAWSEEWGLAYVCGLVPRLVEGVGGLPAPEAIDAAIAEPRFGHLPRTCLVCLENTHNNAGGVPLTAEGTVAVAEVAHRSGVATHLDGARLFNAAAALGVPLRALTAPVDTVAIGLAKGLGAPEGALLCGPARTIVEARVGARRIGAGGLHKAGIPAAAGLVALTEMLDQPAKDNRAACRLAAGLGEIPGLSVVPAPVRTNIVIARPAAPVSAHALVAGLAERGVLALARSAETVRFVTHRLIGDAEIARAVAVVTAVLRELAESQAGLPHSNGTAPDGSRDVGTAIPASRRVGSRPHSPD